MAGVTPGGLGPDLGERPCAVAPQQSRRARAGTAGAKPGGGGGGEVKAQLAAGGATQGGPLHRFLMGGGVARPGASGAACLPFLWVPSDLQTEEFHNRAAHI